jgi:hypothetical protein
LTISVEPTRETYHHFSLDELKKSGRELINGLSSLSSVSNRKWWSMFVDSGVRYYSVNQKGDNNYPSHTSSLHSYLSSLTATSTIIFTEMFAIVFDFFISFSRFVLIGLFNSILLLLVTGFKI